MARIVSQWHEHLAMPQPLRPHVVFNDGDPAGIAVLVAKPFKDPLRGMSLLSRPTLIPHQDPINDPGKPIQLRTRRRPAPPISGGHRKRQHLGDRPRVDPKTPRRLPLAHTFDLNGKTHPSIKLHALIPRPLSLSDKGHLLPDFYSGATGPPGRFSEGFLLRRLHSRRCALSRACVPSSSAPMRRDYPATSAARIAARRRVWLISHASRPCAALRPGGHGLLAETTAPDCGHTYRTRLAPERS